MALHRNFEVTEQKLRVAFQTNRLQTEVEPLPRRVKKTEVNCFV